MPTVVVAPPSVAEPTTPIKPSEALRLGRLLRPRRLRFSYREGADGACAYEAMCIGGASEYVNVDECPAGCSAHGTVSHLVDRHDWSDDRIVGWLQGLGL